MSDEGDELVSKYVDDMGISGVRVGSGFTGGDTWGVRGYPSAALIDPDGKVAWTGHPSEVTSGKVKKLLKGAKKSSGGYLAYTLDREVGPALSGAVKSAESGKLGKAILAARDAAADESLGEAARSEADAIAAEYEAYAELLLGQAESLIEKRSMVKGIEVYETLTKALGGTDYGQRADRRLDEIGKDEDLQQELDADEAYAKAMEAVARRGTKKATSKFEAIVKKYEGTAAAARARKWLLKH